MIDRGRGLECPDQDVCDKRTADQYYAREPHRLGDARDPTDAELADGYELKSCNSRERLCSCLCAKCDEPPFEHDCGHPACNGLKRWQEWTNESSTNGIEATDNPRGKVDLAEATAILEAMRPRLLRRLARSVKFWWQRRVRGWDDSDLWNLDHSLAKLILPRLRQFKELTSAYPFTSSPKEWRTELETMIAAFEVLASDDCYKPRTREEEAEIQRGLDLFAKRYRSLWD